MIPTLTAKGELLLMNGSDLLRAISRLWWVIGFLVMSLLNGICKMLCLGSDCVVKLLHSWRLVSLTLFRFPLDLQMCRRVCKGIPLQVRGQVWSLLLDIENVKQANEGKYEV